MATCGSKNEGSVCTLDREHLGPNHVDESTNTGWPDKSLPIQKLSEDELIKPPEEGVL